MRFDLCLWFLCLMYQIDSVIDVYQSKCYLIFVNHLMSFKENWILSMWITHRVNPEGLYIKFMGLWMILQSLHMGEVHRNNNSFLVIPTLSSKSFFFFFVHIYISAHVRSQRKENSLEISALIWNLWKCKIFSSASPIVRNQHKVEELELLWNENNPWKEVGIECS